MVWCDAKNLSWIWSRPAFPQIAQNPCTVFYVCSWQQAGTSWQKTGDRIRGQGRHDEQEERDTLHWSSIECPLQPLQSGQETQSDPWRAFFLFMPAFGLNYGNLIRHWGNSSSAAKHWGELPRKAARMSWSCTQGDGWTGATIPASRQKWGVSVSLKSCSDLPFCDFYPDDALLPYWWFVSECCYYNTLLSAAPLLITPAV